jgi:hypothetical protein
MRNNRPLAAVAVIACLLALWRFRAASGEPSTDAPPLALECKPDLELRYDLRYESAADVFVPGAGTVLPVGFELDGALVLRCLGERDGGHEVAVRFADLATVHTVVGGTSATDEDAPFNDREAVALIRADGSIEHIRFAADAPSQFQSTMQAILGETQLTRPPGAGPIWEVDELAQRGPARTRYSLAGRTNAGWLVHRVRTRYEPIRGLEWLPGAPADQRLSYAADIELHRDGYLRRVAVSEQLVVPGPDSAPALDSKMTMTLELVSITAAPVKTSPALASGVTRTLDEPAVGDEMRRDLLRSRVDGLTWAEVEAGVLGYRADAVHPDHKRWLWRAVGLLELEPERAGELVPLFARQDLPDDARFLVLDLLTSAGHDEAQRALRDIMSNPLVQDRDDAYIGMIQRLSNVRAPNADTAHFVAQAYADNEGHRKTAAAYTLGATIHGLSDSGDADDEALAHALNERLTADLHDAGDSSTQRELLYSLANAGRADNLPTVAEFAAADDPSVRAAAARALHKTQNNGSEGLVLDLLADASPYVQSSALATLANFELSPVLATGMLEHVESGQVAARNYYALLPLARRVSDSATRQRILQHMLEHGPDDPKLRARTRAALRDSHRSS